LGLALALAQVVAPHSFSELPTERLIFYDHSPNRGAVPS
jgi:hypothetical protein